MATSQILLLTVSAYPCGAVAALLMPPLLRWLGRMMREEEDPRVAVAWLAVAISCVECACALWLLSRAAAARPAVIALGRYGFTVDTLGPMACTALSVVIALAGIAMVADARAGRAAPVALMVAGAAAVVALTGRDVRQVLLAAEVMTAALAFALARGADKREGRRAAWLYWLAWQPGLALVAVALLSTCARAGITDVQVVRDVIAIEAPANIAAMRMLTLGCALALALPMLPVVVRDILSRHAAGGTIAAFCLGAGALAWLFARTAYGMFPYAEAWEFARRGWTLPLLAVASAAAFVGSALMRGPSDMASLALAAQSLWPLVAFATGGREEGGFRVGLMFCAALPLSRAALLAVATSASGAPYKISPKLKQLAGTAVVAVFAAGALWFPLRFRGWWVLPALAVLVAPAAWAAGRLSRFCETERPRIGTASAAVAATAGLLALAALLPLPTGRAAAILAARDLGVHMSFRPQNPGAPPPVNAPRTPERPLQAEGDPGAD